MKYLIYFLLLLIDNYRGFIRLKSIEDKYPSHQKKALPLSGKKIILLGNGKSLNQLDKYSIINDAESISVGLSLTTLHEYNAKFYYSEAPSRERFLEDQEYYQKYLDIRNKAILHKAGNTDVQFIFDESCVGDIEELAPVIKYDELKSNFRAHINMRLHGSHKLFTYLIDIYTSLQQLGICSKRVTLGNFSLFRLLQMSVMLRAKEIHLIGFDFGGMPFYADNCLIINRLKVNVQSILQKQAALHSKTHVTNNPELNKITAEQVISAFAKICSRRKIKFYIYERRPS